VDGWLAERMDYWFDGKLECWKIERLEPSDNGMMKLWNDGRLHLASGA